MQQPVCIERPVRDLNTAIKDAAVKRYPYDSHDQMRTLLADFMDGIQILSQTRDAQRPHIVRRGALDLPTQFILFGCG